MSPCPASRYGVDACGSYAKLFRNLRLAFSIGDPLADQRNKFFCQFGRATSRTIVPNSRMSAFRHFVQAIIVLCTQSQMRRIDARRVVAGVHDDVAYAGRQAHSMAPHVSVTVRVDVALSCTEAKHAIALGGLVSLPFPAFVRRTWREPFQKAFFRRPDVDFSLAHHASIPCLHTT